LRPLLADLTAAEWQLDLRQPAGGTVEFALSVRLDNVRSQAWQNTLTPVVAAWKMTSPRHHGGLARNGEWLVLTLGDSAAPIASGAVPPLKNAWLTADLDWGRLAAWYPAFRKLDLPATRIQVAGHNGNFEMNGKLFLAQSLPTLEPWQFPTNTIHAPYVSFTAARGISTWLKQQPWVTALGLKDLPDQMFTWTLQQNPYQTYAAFPLASAPAAVPAVEHSVAAFLHDSPPNSSYQRMSLVASNNQVSLLGVPPLMAPYLEARREPAGEYLMAGFLPNASLGRAVPPQMLAWQGLPGLVYYHWENTAERWENPGNHSKMFAQLYQLLFYVTDHRQLETNTLAGQWVNRLAPTLGATVTEAFETAPNEVSFTRQAPAGMTALDLVVLSSWLEAPDFPGCDLRMPPRKIIRRLAAPPPGAPLPFPVHQP